MLLYVGRWAGRVPHTRCPVWVHVNDLQKKERAGGWWVEKYPA